MPRSSTFLGARVDMQQNLRLKHVGEGGFGASSEDAGQDACLPYQRVPGRVPALAATLETLGGSGTAELTGSLPPALGAF